MRPQSIQRIFWLMTICAAAGCGEENRFFIVQNQVPDEGCVVAGQRSTAYRGEGVLDVSLIGETQTHAYRLFPLLQNDLPSAGSKGAPQPNRLTVKGFRVRVGLGADAPPAARQLFDVMAADELGRRYLSYDEPWSGTLEPGGSTVSAGVTAVPGEIARRLRASGLFQDLPQLHLMATVRAVGARQAGDLDTPEFHYPITVCDGCLVAFAGACPIATRQFPGNACNVAQDEPVDCCLEGGIPRCPAPVKMSGGAAPAADR
jgi:hypothetical protein